MCRVIDQIGDYKILQTSRDYIVKNTKAGQENYGHFRGLKTCRLIIKLMQKRQVPKGNYLRGAAIRMSTDASYIEKIKHKIERDKDKQRYYNSQKGVRR